MNKSVKKSIRQWLGIFAALISYYLVHEGVHLVLALCLGVFERIHLVGIWGVQIVTTPDALHGVELAVFSGLSSVVTVLVGYLLAFNSSIFKIKNKNILVGMYYITVCFLLLDPLYISVLSNFIGGGGDLNGITTGLSISGLPFKLMAAVIFAINLCLFIKKVVPNYNLIFKKKEAVR